MTRLTLVLATLALMFALGFLTNRDRLQAQSSPALGGDGAVAALVTEVRALRADLAAASRNQLRAQMLLGRVQMQEQRLAYLDKQRSDIAAYAAAQAQMTSGLRNQVEGFKAGQCAGLPSPEQEGTARRRAQCWPDSSRSTTRAISSCARRNGSWKPQCPRNRRAGASSIPGSTNWSARFDSHESRNRAS